MARTDIWHKNHDKYLKDNYGKIPRVDLLNGLMNIEPKVIRTIGAIHVRCSFLKLTHGRNKDITFVKVKKNKNTDVEPVLKEHDDFLGKIIKRTNKCVIYKTPTGIIHKSK
ncbi:MAG: hypothetical protein ACD_33C00024G0002 [uncultured bacterium]|nr:MAG: hypothetical protein ACD_33C00024G0002 [uncultured bacterium]